MMKLQTEFCIIGSGIAGSIVAQELLAAGVQNIIMIEAGKPVTMQDKNKWFKYASTGIEPFEHAYDLENEYTNKGEINYPLRTKRMWAKGGTTNCWAGHSFRMKPEDFHLHANTGRGADWPITYDDLEAFYTLAEKTLQVAGDSQDKGHPPRSGPFPLPAFPYSSGDKIYLETLEKMGFSFQHNCIARNSISINGMPECRTIGTCTYCPEGARFTGDQLVDFINVMPNLTLLTAISALRLKFTDKAHANSLEIFIQDTGELGEIEADKFIVCCGGIESPKLLLASANGFWQDGVGNDYDLVGRFFTEHPGITCCGLLESCFRDPEAESPFNTACSRQFDDYLNQSLGKFMIEVYDVRDYNLLTKIKMGISIEEMEQDIARGLPLSLGALIEATPQRDNTVQLSKGKNRFGVPNTAVNYSLDATTRKSIGHAYNVLSEILTEMGCHDISSSPLVWWASHHMGTCRAGKNPSVSVVDENLRIHGTENVYVCSSAIFPSAGAANPTLTIAALAHRLGQYLTNFAAC